MNAVTQFPARVPAAPVWKRVMRNENIGRQAKENPRPKVQRYASSPRSPKLLLPLAMAMGRMCSTYSDGGTRLAFCIAEQGDFKVIATTHRWREVCIPSAYCDMIPFGMQEVDLIVEHGMLVLETTNLKQVLK
jgi:hypothetical protein